MARSSGGGSRSGGSRSSSSRSSSSRSHGGGGSGHRVSNRPFYGARKFRYRRNGVDHYVYSDTDLTKKRDNKPRWLLLLFYLPFFAAIFGMWSSVFVLPESPMQKSASSVVAVYDDGNVFTDQEEANLTQALNRFTDTTGIVTQVVTVEWNEWQKATSWFDEYALDRYYVQFQDENCWLLAYSEQGGGLVDWEWEGIQGDNTIDVMDVFIDDFNQGVQSSLMSSNDPDVDTAFIAALSGAVDDFESQKFRIDVSGLIPALFVTAFVVFHCGVMVFAGSNFKYSNKELVEVDADGEQGIVDNDVLHVRISPTSSVKNKEFETNNDIGYRNDSTHSSVTSKSEYNFESEEVVSNDFDNIMSGGMCHFCGKTYDKLEDGRCPHCKALLNY